MQNFFGQLNHILLLELPSSQQLNFSGDEVVDLSTLQCVVGRLQDRDKWAIIDQSNNVDIQVD